MSPGRRTNLALLVLLAIALGTGAAAYATGTATGRWVVAAHGAAGLAIVALSPWKAIVVGRSVRRRAGSPWWSTALTVLVLVALLTGVLHATGARSMGPVTSMQLHVALALLAVPFAGWHVLARPVRLRRTDLSRRTALRTGALAGGAAGGWLALEGAQHVLSLPGADRRFTGSHERGSFEPGDMPVTQWLDDDVPSVDAARWRLRVGDEEWRYDEVAAFDDRLRATIDCTGGWFAKQDWEGVWLHRLLPGWRAARSVAVGSVTGYGRRLPAGDAPRLLLATRVGGEPLSPGHGYPARLVAAGRRGFWWVKWVDSVRLSRQPWWWQPPFPIT